MFSCAQLCEPMDFCPPGYTLQFKSLDKNKNKKEKEKKKVLTLFPSGHGDLDWSHTPGA